MSEEKQVEEKLEEVEAEEGLLNEFLAPEEVPAEAVVVEEEKSEHHVKVAIKSLEFRPRGKAGIYRAGGVYVLRGAEAKELVEAGIAIVVEDPCKSELTIPDAEVVE